ncbi:MFS transporter [Thermopolyspora sp. NPDC052614]|uniref:MFS transporter n=1 Tax=Thermopolyspora sp. NPDC052614 TaxID=3155682 RepID=UPI003431E8CD
MAFGTGTAPASRRTVFAAAFVGTSIESYDYYIFGTASALVFETIFFPRFDATAGTLAAFATFAVGFLARPIGAAVVGHFGDRVGRTPTLIVTLLLIGGSTFLIGVLPTYAAVGVAAPLLLVVLRVLQGFGASGEWGGAILIATESAGPGRRALYGSFAQFGVPVGVLTSNLAFLAVSGMSDDSFEAYGWRIPFLISIGLVVFGLVMRRRLSESPEFERMRRENRIVKLPVNELVGRDRRNLVLGALAAMAPPALGYTVIVYMLTYGTQQVGFERSTLLTLILSSTVIWIGAIYASARVSDRVGAKKVYLAGALSAVIWPIPMFALVNTGRVAMALPAFVVAAIVQGVMAGAQGGLFTEMFDVRVRYSGISIAYSAGGVIGGAVTPLVAAALFKIYETSTAVALYISALSLISLVAVSGVQKAGEAARWPWDPVVHRLRLTLLPSGRKP